MIKKILALLLLVILCAGALIYYYQNLSRDKDALLLYGNVDIRQVDLGFQVSGRVKRLFFEEGDTVKKGELIASLDERPYNDQLKEAHANMAAIRVNLENGKSVFDRRKELITDGSVSQEDLENAGASYRALQANLAQAEASLAVSETNLKFTSVYAPTDGFILTRIREPGTVVSPGDAVVTLSIATPIWIRAYVSEPELGLIYPGMEAEVKTDSSTKIYKGKIGFISPVAEFTPKTVETTQLRTDLVYRLRIYVSDPDHGLRQGMPVTVRLALAHHEAQ